MEMYDNVMQFNNGQPKPDNAPMESNSEKADPKPEADTDFSYKGYEVVHGAFFAHLFEPSVKLVKETVSVNAACIRKLPGTEYVQFLVNRDEKKLAVKSCTEDTKDSFRWASIGKNGKPKPKTISCKPFFDRVMRLMEWDPNMRYRISGKLIRTKTESIFVFDLKDRESYQRKGKAMYPDEWNEGFGVSAEEHDNDALVSFCENDSVFYLEKDETQEEPISNMDMSMPEQIPEQQEMPEDQISESATEELQDYAGKETDE